ncbi:MAG: hypothetical protein ACSHX7_13320 [Luteolibacter sp.]
MKTSLACFGILIAALFLGKIQGSRLGELQKKIPNSGESRRSKFSERPSTDEVPVYRSKYQRTTNNAVAKDVLQTVIGHLAGRKSTQTGDLASMTDRNTEALKAILQLDVSGIKELISMISESEDQALNMNGAVKYEQISLCVIALADQDPGYAFDYVTNIGQEIDLKIFRDYDSGNWLRYVLTRLSVRDPQRALNGLLEVAQDPVKPWGDDRVLDSLAKIACWEPGAVLDIVDRLPEEKSKYFLESLTYEMKSDDEYTAFFQALRSRYSTRPERMEAGFFSLLERFRDGRESPVEIRKWTESLEMSDLEKSLLLNSLNSIDIRPAVGEEYARWFADFLPESPGRKRLIWNAVNSWSQLERQDAADFLNEQNIDPQEMLRLEGYSD